MKRLAALMLVVFATVAFATTAAADRRVPTLSIREMMGLIHGGGQVTIPPEWDGIWAYADSSYDCIGNFTDESAGDDTLCAGAVVYQLTHSGAADAAGSPARPNPRRPRP